MEITRGVLKKPLRVVVYGPEGIGKTTFASKFPLPLFIDTENSTDHIDVARLPKPSSWTMLLQEVEEAKALAGQFQTLVVDTADWAETLCKQHIIASRQMKSIEDAGYGKGYVYLAEEWGKLLNALTGVRDAGLNVVLTAHAIMRKFEQPEEMGAYDRWELKLEKKTAPMTKEWADLILFANYEVHAVKTSDAKGAKSKAQGGKRVMYTSHHPCWDAKNRQGLPEKLSFSFDEICNLFLPAAQAWEQSHGAMAAPPPATQPAPPPPAETQARTDRAEPGPEWTALSPAEDLPFYDSTEKPPQTPAAPPKAAEVPEGIPKALADLMRAHGVTEGQIQAAVASRGYYPADTPIRNYDPNFITGVLVGAWEQVYHMIKG